MRTRVAPARTVPTWVLPSAIGLLVVSNVVSNAMLPDALYVPWNLAMAAALLWLALGPGGLCRRDVGLDRRDLGAGLRWGGAAFALVLGLLVVAAVIPSTRELFEDARVRDTSAWTAVYQVLVRIPLGTVVLEEVAFRGVLLGLITRRAGLRAGVVWSSVLFGLWHVLPSLGIDGVNPVADGVFDGSTGAALAVAAAVVGTALAGLVFTFLRVRSGSLVAPMLLHTATNSASFTVAWLVLHPPA